MYRVETRTKESDEDYATAIAFDSKEEAEEYDEAQAAAGVPGFRKVVGDDDSDEDSGVVVTDETEEDNDDQDKEEE